MVFETTKGDKPALKLSTWMGDHLQTEAVVPILLYPKMCYTQVICWEPLRARFFLAYSRIGIAGMIRILLPFWA